MYQRYVSNVEDPSSQILKIEAVFLQNLSWGFPKNLFYRTASQIRESSKNNFSFSFWILLEHLSSVTNPFTGPYVQRQHRGQLLRVLPQPAVRNRLQPRVLRRAGPKQVTDWPIKNLPGNWPDIDNQHFRVKSLDHWRHHSKQSCKEISAPPIWISSVQLQIDELLFDSVSK